MLVAHLRQDPHRKVLGVAAASCYSMNVQAGTQYNIRALGSEFSGRGIGKSSNLLNGRRCFSPARAQGQLVTVPTTLGSWVRNPWPASCILNAGRPLRARLTSCRRSSRLVCPTGPSRRRSSIPASLVVSAMRRSSRRALDVARARRRGQKEQHICWSHFASLALLRMQVFAASRTRNDQYWLDDVKIPVRCRVRQDSLLRGACLLVCYKTLAHAFTAPSSKAAVRGSKSCPFGPPASMPATRITAIHQCGLT